MRTNSKHELEAGTMDDWKSAEIIGPRNEIFNTRLKIITTQMETHKNAV